MAPSRPPPPLFRAYKLGKKRWSYNQVELRLGEASATRRAVVQQAVAAGGSKLLPEGHQVCAHCWAGQACDNTLEAWVCASAAVGKHPADA